MLLAPVRSISSMKYNINRIDGIWVNYVFSCSNESDGRHASLQCHFWWRQWAQTRYLVPTACVRWLIPIDFEWGRTRNALWIRPFRWFRWRRQKVEQFSTFFGSDGSVIQSDRVCKFKHCDATRALTILENGKAGHLASQQAGRSGKNPANRFDWLTDASANTAQQTHIFLTETSCRPTCP